MAQISAVFKPSFSYSNNISRNQVAPLIQTLIFWLSLQGKVIQCFEGYRSNKSTSKHCILRNCLSGSYENWSSSVTTTIFFLFQMLLLPLIHMTQFCCWLAWVQHGLNSPIAEFGAVCASSGESLCWSSEGKCITPGLHREELTETEEELHKLPWGEEKSWLPCKQWGHLSEKMPRNKTFSIPIKLTQVTAD